MTSSLVGSEMCIRDSPHSKFFDIRAQPRDTQRTRPAGWHTRALPPPNPVSYTHLTLPTICSV
eukprot:396852-Prorocentrum_lima.AAC.1